MVNLKDTTIVIPFRIESPDREINLNILLAWFCKETEVFLLLLEADSVPRYRIIEDAERIRYFFVEDTDYIFYHMRYRNELIRKADTSIVGIWNTDSIIPIIQIEKAVMSIQQGIAKITYPYSAASINIDSETVESFKKEMDISILLNTMEKLPLNLELSTVGGPFFVDKKVYLQAGGENENFYGWGAEDAERIKRMGIIGYPLYQVEGLCIHLWHFREENSGGANYEFQRRNKKEFVKICEIRKLELENYISTWDCKGDTIYVSLIGRIGNVLFQIAAAAFLAKKKCCKFVAIPSYYYAPESDNCLLKYYLEPSKINLLRKVTFIDQYPDRYKLYKEPYFHHTPITFQEGMLLEGFFQSEKYLDKDFVRGLFGVDSKTETYIREKYIHLLKDKVTGINVRRGDFLKHPDSHPVCSLGYYSRAIEIIGSDKCFLISSDDIPWCKEHFKGDNFFFVEHISPVIDLYVQTFCTNNIISNSTFSWWGAWLNPHPDKVVIAPKKWFGKDNRDLDTKDLLPEEWMLI